MENVDYDLVIIGGGPAGLTAGIYASRARLKTVLIEKIVPGGQILVTDWLENYPGFPDGISGPDLVDKFTAHAKNAGVTIESGDVQSITIDGDNKVLMVDGKKITTKTVIIASGAHPRKLGAPNETKFFGRGISTCATCDAPFYKEKVVAAVGGGDTAVKESLYLTKFVDKLYLIHRRDELRAEKILQERILANPKIEIIWDSVVTDFGGMFGLESVGIKNVKTGEEKTLPVDGCFVWVGILPNTEFIGDLPIEVDAYGFIKTDANMATSVPGIFAAGDVRDTPLRQVATAVGDSTIAAISAEHYIDGL